MRVPLSYRLALRAYPRAYRVQRAPELMATLAEGDEERGRASLREAAALVRRGLAKRVGMHDPADWLLAAAAALVLAALVGGFTWAERRFLFRGDVAAFATDGPGVWWALTLGLGAYVALVGLFFDVLERPRRQRGAVLLAAPLALVCFPIHARVFYEGLPNPVAVLDDVVWTAEAVFHNRSVTVPMTLVAIAATWVALTALRRMAPEMRRRVLSAVLAVAAAIAVAQSLLRPEVPSYAQSAFADLGTAAFLTALAIPLALAALVPRRVKPQL
jgi:hypothetical protein